MCVASVASSDLFKVDHCFIPTVLSLLDVCWKSIMFTGKDLKALLFPQQRTGGSKPLFYLIFEGTDSSI